MFDYVEEKVIPMRGKGTGKYYAPVYRAKKSPAKLRRIRLFKRCAVIAAAVTIVAVSIAAIKISSDDSASFVKVAASEQLLVGVSSYPRIVDQSSPLPEDYVPENLVALGTLPNGENVFLRADAAEAFLTMCSAMSEDGLGIVPGRGYVSYEDQSSLLPETAARLDAAGATAEAAEKAAKAEVFAPGEDEAQLGTSIDVSVSAEIMDQFVLTEQFQWIARNAWHYGFIIRYTSANQKYTGVEERPWHLRYVGKEAAEFMAAENKCLESYIRIVKADNPDAKEEA